MVSHHSASELCILVPSMRLHVVLIELHLSPVLLTLPTDTVCVGTCEQGRRPIRTSDTGMQLCLDVIRWCPEWKTESAERFWR